MKNFYTTITKSYKNSKARIKMMPLISIIIVNRNGGKLLKKTLESIECNTNYENYKIIIVDNGSYDNSISIIKNNFPWVKLIINKENLGFSKANNQGIKYALKEKTDYILLLNNDIEMVNKDWLRNMVKTIESDPKIGIVGCKLIYPNGKEQHSYGQIIFNKEKNRIGLNYYDQFMEVDYVIGAVFLIKKEVVDKIGLLDEGFTPIFFEEIDYCVRCKKAGYKVIHNPRVIVVHHVGETVRKTFSNFQREFIFNKNRIRFMLLNFPLKQLIMYLIKLPIAFLFEKKRMNEKINPFNIKLRKNGRIMFIILLKAYFYNLKNIPEIVYKRINRELRIWY